MEHDINIGIIGGSGFVGSSLALYLIKKGYCCKIIDIKEFPKHLRNENLIHFTKADIRDYKQLSHALRDVDFVVNTAIIQIPYINEKPFLGLEVNVKGTINLCNVILKTDKIRGAILTSSWHIYGERVHDTLRETSGYLLGYVSDRARRYVFSKIIQELIFRYFHESSDKIFGIIRLGTVLGEYMPSATAASIFIRNAIKGKPVTPFKDSMYRPMLYVDIIDVTKAIKKLINNVIQGKIKKSSESSNIIYNLFYPEPITILELAEYIRRLVIELTDGRIVPQLKIVDTKSPQVFSEDDKRKLKTDISKTLHDLGLKELNHPKDSLRRIILHYLKRDNLKKAL